MSAVIRRNSEGVVLRYADPSVLRPHHTERRHQISDRERCALVAAERELLTMAVIFDHLEISGIARNRLEAGLHRIRAALDLRRPDYGMDMNGADQIAKGLAFSSPALVDEADEVAA
jgi:hypothetical protein